MLLLLPLLPLALAGEIPVQDCGSSTTTITCSSTTTTGSSTTSSFSTTTGSSAAITSIQFDGCEELPCVVHHGTHALAQVSLTAVTPATSLTCQIVGVIPGTENTPEIELPFNGCPKNACDNMAEGSCPVEEGEELVYGIDLPVEAYYPPIEILARWKLIDENDEMFVCFEVPMKIEA